MNTILSSSLALALATALAVACNSGEFSGASGKEPPRKTADANKPGAKGGDPGKGTGTGSSPGTGTNGGSGSKPGKGSGPGAGSTGGSGSNGSTDVGSGSDDGPLIPPDCDEKGATQAKLITKELPIYTDGQQVEYEIYLTDCDGKVKNLASEDILFDVNAYAGGTGLGLTYQLFDSKTNAKLAEGYLNEIQGQDLFGKTGPEFYHYRTDVPLKVASDAESFRMKVTVPNGCCSQIGTSDPTTDQVIDTFLRLGLAAPVKKVVTFKYSPNAPNKPAPSGGSSPPLGPLQP